MLGAGRPQQPDPQVGDLSDDEAEREPKRTMLLAAARYWASRSSGSPRSRRSSQPA